MLYAEQKGKIDVVFAVVYGSYHKAKRTHGADARIPSQASCPRRMTFDAVNDAVGGTAAAAAAAQSQIPRRMKQKEGANFARRGSLLRAGACAKVGRP